MLVSLFLSLCTYLAKDEKLLTNLRQYGLEDRYIDMLVCDAARPVWRQDELFDAIITDREWLGLIINNY